MKGEHQALFEAAVAGHADRAVALLHAHFERTARVILGDAARLEITPLPGRARPAAKTATRPHVATRQETS